MELSEYRAAIDSVNILSEKMLAAYNSSDYKEVIMLCEQIGAIYGDDPNDAHRIAYMLQIIASTHYFGGIIHHIDETFAAQRAKQFAPPF
jgi:hypothetical protein